MLHGIESRPGANWQAWLAHQLQAQHNQVDLLELSNPDKPQRADWLAELQRSAHTIDPNELVLVGHSLGVVTALDYLESIDMPIHALVSVSGFASDYQNELNSYFLREKSIDFVKVKANVRNAYVFFGDDDPYVTQSALHEVALGLGVEPHVIEKGKHLNANAGYTKFPELLTTVEQL